jgi:hypothetical protein
MGGHDKMLFLFLMTGSAIIHDRCFVELAAGDIRRNNIVLTVTILAHCAFVGAAGNNRFMERVLGDILGMTGLTLDRSDILFMRDIVRIESGMAGGAGKFLVRRGGKMFIVDKKGNGLSLLFHCQRIIRMTRQTFVIRLGQCNGTGTQKKK